MIFQWFLTLNICSTYINIVFKFLSIILVPLARGAVFRLVSPTHDIITTFWLCFIGRLKFESKFFHCVKFSDAGTRGHNRGISFSDYNIKTHHRNTSLTDFIRTHSRTPSANDYVIKCHSRNPSGCGAFIQ